MSREHDLAAALTRVTETSANCRRQVAIPSPGSGPIQPAGLRAAPQWERLPRRGPPSGGAFCLAPRRVDRGDRMRVKDNRADPLARGATRSAVLTNDQLSLQTSVVRCCLLIFLIFPAIRRIGIF